VANFKLFENFKFLLFNIIYTSAKLRIYVKTLNWKNLCGKF